MSEVTQKRHGFAALAALLLAGAAAAQVSVPPGGSFAPNLVVPQSRVYPIPPIWPPYPPPYPMPRPIPAPPPAPVQITQVDVEVKIVEQVATTVMVVHLKNPGRQRQEAEVIAPVPDGAVVRGFTFQGAGKEPTAVLLPKEEARRIYREIVSKLRDPALLEFAGYNLVRSCVFPVEPMSAQKVELTYENLLKIDGNRIDYVLPRSESVDYSTPWRIEVEIKSKQPISTVYSPSHNITTKRESPNRIIAQVASDAATQPGPFRLSYLLEQNGVTASLLAYPDAKIGGGYFLLLAGLPAKLPKGGEAQAIKREVTLVLDRSGSMNGEKLEQAQEAALQVLAGLEDGEAFNLIVYQSTVDLFAEKPVLKNAETMKAARAYIKQIKARGGTNIHDALTEALRQKPVEGMLPIVLFLTDGLPTVGNTSERAIRELAAKGNPHNRRIFTFGVGVDVNTPLLEKIAWETRGAPTFVLPKEDVEVKVAQVFNRLYGPALAYPELRARRKTGPPDLRPVREALPDKIPDLFEGDQLVVVGQYVGDEPLIFELTGNYLGRERTFTFQFALDHATTRNSFVPRLWASRKIAVLIDAIRQLGADAGTPGTAPPAHDPRFKELVDEVVKLSIEFGILTEYTAFLAREGTDIAHAPAVMSEARDNFARRALEARSGYGAVSQSLNLDAQRQAKAVSPRNTFYDENLNRVEVTSVQQVSDRAFYKRGNRWVDSRVAAKADEAKPDRTVEFASDEFFRLVEKLAAENRQSCVSLRGEILLKVDGETVLVTQ